MVTICDYKQSQSISNFNRVMCPEDGGWSFSWGRGIVVCGGVHISSGCLPSARSGTSELCQCVPWHPELFHNMSGIIQWFWLWGRLEKCTRECEMVFLLRETPVKESCLICKFNIIINVFLTVYGGTHLYFQCTEKLRQGIMRSRQVLGHGKGARMLC